jgi:hypothetical protein
MNAQISIFDAGWRNSMVIGEKPKTIKEKTLEALKSEWLSTTQLIFRTGASSADRRRRDLEAEGYQIINRIRSDGIIEYHCE